MSTVPADASSSPPRTAARRALLRFLAGTLIALVLVAVATFVVARQVAQDVALRHARMRGATFARVVGGPLVTPGVTAGRPQDLAAFTAVMRNRLRDRSMVHIKVWSPQGRVIWADEHGLRDR